MEQEERPGTPPDRPFAADAPPPPAGDFQRVEVERMDSEEPEHPRDRAMGGGVRIFTMSTGTALETLRPPILSTWICLALAWFFLGSKIPFTVFIGVPLNLAALVLSMICLTRGGLITGILGLGLGTVGSVAVYLVGLFRFLVME